MMSRITFVVMVGCMVTSFCVDSGSGRDGVGVSPMPGRLASSALCRLSVLMYSSFWEALSRLMCALVLGCCSTHPVRVMVLRRFTVRVEAIALPLSALMTSVTSSVVGSAIRFCRCGFPLSSPGCLRLISSGCPAIFSRYRCKTPDMPTSDVCVMWPSSSRRMCDDAYGTITVWYRLAGLRIMSWSVLWHWVPYLVIWDLWCSFASAHRSSSSRLVGICTLCSRNHAMDALVVSRLTKPWRCSLPFLVAADIPWWRSSQARSLFARLSLVEFMSWRTPGPMWAYAWWRATSVRIFVSISHFWMSVM